MRGRAAALPSILGYLQALEHAGLMKIMWNRIVNGTVRNAEGSPAARHCECVLVTAALPEERTRVVLRVSTLSATTGTYNLR